MRVFTLDGQETTDRTYRTALIEHYVDAIPSKTFLDIGAHDGYESRAVALLGAKRVVAVEGKREPFEAALAATKGLRNVDVLCADVRAMNFGTFDIALCFGFLYHLQNPFHFLKRLRKHTTQRLLLETHIAPRTLRGVLPKHAASLPFEMHQVELDGVTFEGKIVPHRGSHNTTKGSLDAPWTFWLTRTSLLMALVDAGFTIHAYYYRIDADTPEVMRKWGSLLGVGHANTKVWVVADSNGQSVESTESLRVLRGNPEWRDGLVARVRRRFL